MFISLSFCLSISVSITLSIYTHTHISKSVMCETTQDSVTGAVKLRCVLRRRRVGCYWYSCVGRPEPCDNTPVRTLCFGFEHWKFEFWLGLEHNRLVDSSRVQSKAMDFQDYSYRYFTASLPYRYATLYPASPKKRLSFKFSIWNTVFWNPESTI